MNSTERVKPLTHSEKIKILEEVAKWGSEQGYNGLVKKTLKDLENLRQSQRVMERA
jgi:hypothetical protein